MLLTLFVLAIFLLLYPLVIYPPLVWLLARLFPRPVKKSRPAALPTLTIVIPAHNEEAVIAAKIKNTLACDYPMEKVEILVASDGSTDRTVERTKDFVHPSLFLLDFPVRRGKLSVLVDAVSRARGEIVVLTDASSRSFASPSTPPRGTSRNNASSSGRLMRREPDNCSNAATLTFSLK